MAAGRIGNTGSISFATSSFTARMVGIPGMGISRASVDVTNLTCLGADLSASSAVADWSGLVIRTKRPGTIDMGDTTFSCSYDPAEKNPIIDYGTSMTESITLSMPLDGTETTAGTLVAPGFVSNFNTTGEMDGHVTADITVTWAGAPTAWTKPG